MFQGIFNIVRHLSGEPEFWAENRIFINFSKSLKTCLVFSIARHLSQEPDFWAENQIFKNFLKSLKTCLVGVFWVFHCLFSIIRHLHRESDFWAENSVFIFLKPLNMFRTGFLSWEPDFKKILKKPPNMFSWCFLSVSRYFSIVRNLSREPDFWAENRIFKNFSKSLKHV